MELALALLFCLAFSSSVVAAANAVDWWEGASLYQIYPRSFQDSDGDGVGDIKGITSRLEYLKEIGITATWLSPVFESPMSDFGYDISNFTRIDPIFGTLDDFDAMVAKAKQLGVKILLDFVPNHSSDKCEWFQKSIRREEGFEDFYVWHDGKVDAVDPSKRVAPSNWVSVFGGSQWTWNAERQQFYLHQFQDKQPDLNYSNPLVRQHMLEVLEYWLDRGVDGFRIDAVPHIFEKRNDDGSYPDEPLSGWSNNPNSYDYHNHIHTKDQYATIELLYEWREFLEQYQKKNGGETRVLLAEAYSSVETLSEYFGNGTHSGAHLPMNFNLMYLNGYSTARDMENSINYWMHTMWTNHQTANWVVGNHDNNRVADRMGHHKVDLLNIIVNTLPGASVTYYGEEIGMSNVPTECTSISCDSRDPERSPMQWTPGTNAGFTDGPSTWLPISSDYMMYNVETERMVGRSSLNILKALQSLKHTAAFRNFKEQNGFSYRALSEQVFQIVRAVPNREEYMVLVNMGNKLEYVEQIASRTFEYVLVSPHSSHNNGDKVDLNGRIYLMPFEAVVLRWMER
ncbi:maltase A2 [Stomoxys calcitrans]|uniref:maltase A2 n=1 Tax=Stomoxys calcitrans TaxID=35570 RepID=UPI0027E2DD8D|nr:maltase A2 [Stomoxys calcitrans]